MKWMTVLRFFVSSFVLCMLLEGVRECLRRAGDRVIDDLYGVRSKVGGWLKGRVAFGGE